MKQLELPTPPRRILIIKPSSLGDVTHALPVFYALRRRWPDSHISWLIAPACAGILEGLSGLDELILFERRRFGTAWKSPAAGMDLLRFHRDLRRRQFDLVIDLQGLFRSGWLAWMTGAPYRVGFANARELAWLFYTHRVPIESLEQHAVDRYMKIAAAVGCPTEPLDFTLPIADADRQYIESLIAPGQRYAVLMPGANWLTKRWPIEHFAALVEPLRQRFGLSSVVAGGSDAAELAPKVSSALNLAGRTNLRQLVALLARADLVIANDSGPMHIATALNRPLVAIFGPTNAIRTGPYGRPQSVVRINIDCAPCYSRQCSHLSCLRQLSVDLVLAAAQRELARTHSRQASPPAR